MLRRRKRLMFVLLVVLVIVCAVLVLHRVKVVTHVKRISTIETQDYPSNFPNELFLGSKSLNESCAQLPSPQELHYNNERWQVFHASKGDVYLFGAYMDRRFGRNRVRVLGMSEGYLSETIYCQLWMYDQEEPILVKVEEALYLWYEEWNDGQVLLKPYMLSCVYDGEEIPEAVSLVAEPCDTATNALLVYNSKPTSSKYFAVCVKGLDYHVDISARLIEWMELLRMLGTRQIFFYVYSVHSKVKRVLEYYARQGFANFEYVTLAGYQPNNKRLRSNYLKENILAKRLNEIVAYNDCFYRHLELFKYVVLLDIDEVIVPSKGTWSELLYDVGKNSYASYNFRNVYFLDDFTQDTTIPRHWYILTHTTRHKNISKALHYVKSFFNTDLVQSLHNHLPFNCINGECNNFDVPVELGKLHHYRKDCHESCTATEEDGVIDKTVWRFKERLMHVAGRVMKELNVRP